MYCIYCLWSDCICDLKKKNFPNFVLLRSFDLLIDMNIYSVNEEMGDKDIVNEYSIQPILQISLFIDMRGTLMQV